MKLMVGVASVFCLLFMVSADVGADQGTFTQVPASAMQLKLPLPLQIRGGPSLAKLDAGLIEGDGPREVVVRLKESPSAHIAAEWKTRAAQLQQIGLIRAQQDGVLKRALSLDPGMKVLATLQKSLNAVILSINAASLKSLASDPDVVSIKPVKNYKLNLSETVPYIGAKTVQNLGYDGNGVRVAVLDSGIDYLHANLGGSGNPADFSANNPQIIEAGSFPTAKVVGGYDFVGPSWPDDPLSPDPDPLDAGTGRGHGTHVADIIAGTNGVAPRAVLYAIKVCSSISSSCSGVALLQGIEYAIDPNQDGDTSDHVDIVNLSLGSDYGQAFDDDLSQAVENASLLGVLTVASSGNSSDKPYVTGTPGAAPSALSVAETNVPSAFLAILDLVSPDLSASFEAVWQPWSIAFDTIVQGTIQYGDVGGGNLDGCSAFAAGSLSGRIVLVNRGSCSFSTKIENIGNAGGSAGIIGLIAPGDPFAGGYGGGTITTAGFMISQEHAGAIKTALSGGAVQGNLDPKNKLLTVGSMVGSSSRGPSMLTNIVKPEISAPGASVSAVAGSGTDEIAFGGTSGAAPMVAGAAALLKQAYPGRASYEIKSLLMNTAERNILNKATVNGGALAPVSRIGGGEIRVDNAMKSKVAAWDKQSRSGALSFGFRDVDRPLEIQTRTVIVANYSDVAVRYAIKPMFRYANDQASGAVSLKLPGFIDVPPFSQRSFLVNLLINGEKVHDWAMNSGPDGANPDTLTLNEYDGYIDLEGNDGSAIHLAWHMLPRKAGNIKVVPFESEHRLFNLGVGMTEVTAYSLLAGNGDLPEGGTGGQNPAPDFRYLGYSSYSVDAGVCGAAQSFVLALAVNTWEKQTHAEAPASFQFYLDTDRNGVDDFLVYSGDVVSSDLSDGRNAVWVQDLASNDRTAYFYTDHRTNSANTVLMLCGEQIGMTAANAGTAIGMKANSVDTYFTGKTKDSIEGMIISPLAERHIGDFSGSGNQTSIPFRGISSLDVVDTGSKAGGTEKGLLLLYNYGIENKEAAIVVTR